MTTRESKGEETKESKRLATVRAPTAAPNVGGRTSYGPASRGAARVAELDAAKRAARAARASERAASRFSKPYPTWVEEGTLRPPSLATYYGGLRRWAELRNEQDPNLLDISQIARRYSDALSSNQLRQDQPDLLDWLGRCGSRHNGQRDAYGHNVTAEEADQACGVLLENDDAWNFTQGPMLTYQADRPDILQARLARARASRLRRKEEDNEKLAAIGALCGPYKGSEADCKAQRYCIWNADRPPNLRCVADRGARKLAGLPTTSRGYSRCLKRSWDTSQFRECPEDGCAENSLGVCRKGGVPPETYVQAAPLRRSSRTRSGTTTRGA